MKTHLAALVTLLGWLMIADAATAQPPLITQHRPITQHRLITQGNGKLAIVGRDGQIEWEMPWGGIHDLHVLRQR